MELPFYRRRTQPILLFAVLLLQVPLFVGCLPFVTTSSTVTNLSGKQPYKAFIGKFVIAKESGSILADSTSYNFRPYVICLGPGNAIPFYETAIKKIADFPIGTKIKIHSIKHKKVITEMGGYDGTQALCTIFLQDGRTLDCQMNWDLLNPDPRDWPALRFELIEH